MAGGVIGPLGGDELSVHIEAPSGTSFLFYGSGGASTLLEMSGAEGGPVEYIFDLTDSTNTSSCLESCARNSCGDGVLFVGVEACDDNNEDDNNDNKYNNSKTTFHFKQYSFSNFGSLIIPNR